MTQIGTYWERYTFRYQRLDNLQNRMVGFQEHYRKKSYVIARKITSRLELPFTVAIMAHNVFTKIYGQLPKNKMERNPQNLVPVLIYHVCNWMGITVSYKELIEASGINNHKFREVRKRTLYVINSTRDIHKETVSLIFQYCEKLGYNGTIINMAIDEFIERRDQSTPMIMAVIAIQKVTGERSYTLVRKLEFPCDVFGVWNRTKKIKSTKKQ